MIDVRGTWQLELAGADDRVLQAESETHRHGEAAERRAEQSRRGRREGRGNQAGSGHAERGAARLSVRGQVARQGRAGPRFGDDLAGEDGKLTLLGTLVWADGTSERLTGSAHGEADARTKRSEDSKEQPKDAKGAKEGRQKRRKSETERTSEGRDASDKPEAPALYAGELSAWRFWPRGTARAAEAGGVQECDALDVRAGRNHRRRRRSSSAKARSSPSGKDVAIPEGAVVVDAAGKHITPGIIDCHSHMATDGGVNEATQAITAEVRIGDFIDADDITIYRQLAGGVTAANILHGSANPIGGQNQVIKLRWGADRRADEVRRGAAGHQVRPGRERQAEQLEATHHRPAIRRAAWASSRSFATPSPPPRDYAAAWDRWNQDHEGLPPRRDLELEALAEIVAGQALDSLPQLPAGRDPRPDSHLRRLRHHDRHAAAHPRRLQSRRRDGQARRDRLVVLRLVGLQVRGLSTRFPSTAR